MTSFQLNLPKVRKTPALDLRGVFQSEQTKETAQRVIRFISAAYFEHSEKSHEAITKPVAFVEEFFITMPTRNSFQSEINLCEAILGFAGGSIDEKSIKDTLKKFLDAHTFVYAWEEFGTVSRKINRTVKDGSDFSKWEKNLEFFLFSFAGKSFVCNAIQMWLIYLLEQSKDENLRFKSIKL